MAAEPLLGPLDLRPWLKELDWVIVGGESDQKGRFRRRDLRWARDLRDQCAAAGVPFFYKQGSGYRPGTEPFLDGVAHHALPRTR